ncbi:putative membrane protein YeiH [Novosphingobium chloroacetimidivorans]|uniref:Putative membrane protein YeiH n=1 Tax=Novosphingobium chloroacetimidivorans TaxID=1428314 RepID=A0A7W7KAE7_9SPHN|nr:trimeric intracellular cation channel family protein [Novosphingobium chloroacetimidivorans]MBB4859150.1 putative membrane protein YeiH [Novosphingobium chloroacetimidivorans]
MAPVLAALSSHPLAIGALPLDPPLQVLLPWLDLAGLSVFAASGALAAVRKRLDIVGACFFALVTATGGGTLRDLLIGAPVFWMRDPAPVLICLGVALAAWSIPLRWWPERALDWFDAAGLAAYAVYGAGKALQFGISPIPAVAAGVITACLGGVIRDITAGVPSILLRHELYVTAALAAATLFVLLTSYGVAAPLPALLGTAIGFALRGAAIAWKLTLPAHKGT